MIGCKGVNEKAISCVFLWVKEDGTLPNIQFKNYKNQLKCTFVIYADTESYIKCFHTCAEQKEPNTVKNNMHEGCLLAYNIGQSDRKLTNKRWYQGEDSM